MIKKKELILGICIIIAACVLCIQFYFTEKKNNSYIRITVDGDIYGVYNLKEDQDILIGDTNVCRIENGSAKMIQADCPDHLCMHQKAIDKNGGMIVCLPNQVIIESVASENKEAGDES